MTRKENLASTLYRCRICGQLFEGKTHQERMLLIAGALDIIEGTQHRGPSIPIIEGHYCWDDRKSFGIGDFAGIRDKETP